MWMGLDTIALMRRSESYRTPVRMGMITFPPRNARLKMHPRAIHEMSADEDGKIQLEQLIAVELSLQRFTGLASV